MRVLTNNYSDCDLLNLGYYSGGRGPYVVRQDGIAPGGSTLRSDRFLLRKDGVWVVNVAVFALPPKEQEENFVFDKVSEVMETLENLYGKPTAEDKLPEGKSKEELIEMMKTAQSRLWSHMREAKGTKMSR
jgi:hypothetical protein